MPANAARILTDKQFERQLKQFDAGQMGVLNDMARGKIPGRHAGTMLGAIRTKLEWGHAKPEQKHELTGAVTIRVECSIPTRYQAKAVPVATGDAEVLCLQQGPITANMSTLESAEDQAIPTRSEVTSTETLHRDGRLMAVDTVPMDAEARRAAAREAWLADRDAHPMDEA